MEEDGGESAEVEISGTGSRDADGALVGFPTLDLSHFQKLFGRRLSKSANIWKTNFLNKRMMSYTAHACMRRGSQEDAHLQYVPPRNILMGESASTHKTVVLIPYFLLRNPLSLEDSVQCTYL